MIVISRSSLRDPGKKKKFVASVCHSVYEFLSDDKPISIEMKDGVTLADAAEALRNISEILETAGQVTNSGEDDDPADSWKFTDDAF